MKLNEYEVKHNEYLRSVGAECLVLLKKDGKFPLKTAGKIAVYGSGARRTIKGGTGSGEVNSRFYINVEDGLSNAGFSITSKYWMDAYDKIKDEAKAKFVQDLKAEAKAAHQNPVFMCMGRSVSEPDYEIPLTAEGDTAIYVLSRISGEGSDRDVVKGEILLSDTEIRDILACNDKYENFMLVINAGGVVDLTPVKDVKNILILSQLGVMTGAILADVILGKQNPSGKLTTTWSAWEDYQTIGEFGDNDDTRYKEGIYVGYRYFDSVGKKALYPFGYGLSYSEFEISDCSASLDGDIVTASASVKNVGAFSGKEVVELYVSIPEGKLDEPYQVLAGFAKTNELAPGQEERVTVRFSMKDIAPYEEASESYILEAGDYILRLGNSSADTSAIAAVRVEKELTVLKVKNVLGKPDFTDYKIPSEQKVSSKEELCCILTLDASAIEAETVSFEREYEMDDVIRNLPDDQLIKMNLGAYNPKGGIASIIGNSGFTVAGAAGQTSLEAKEYGIPSLVMADGPAGLRLSREYAVDAKGNVHGVGASLPESFLDFMPKPAQWFMKFMAYKPKKNDPIKEQYATAIPIGTAIAQSFNLELAEKCGDIVGFEMEKFGVHLWLAPALNIHRSIRCGRNFEYFSEDPLVSGMFAGAITRGVQSHPHCGTTIKHFAFNNQEKNRTMNNSQVSERAAREIYLKGFGICVKNSQPKAVMTSYNLINGIHTSELRGLTEDVLRSEFAYKGIVMTDWVIAALGAGSDHKYPVAEAYNVCMAGGDVFMPGSLHDYEGLAKALDEGRVDREQLCINATRIYRMAKELCE